MIGIYKIVSPKGRVYIGESINIEKRRDQYKRGHYQKQWKLARSLEKYGWEAHAFEILEICSISELKERERYYQLLFNSIQKGLNLKLTGIHEVKTQDSLEVGLNRSKGQMGRKQTEETKQKLSLIRKGKPKPIGFGDVIRKAKTGVKLTDQHRSNISNSHKKLCIIDGITYDSCKEAAIALNIPEGTLYHRLLSKKYSNCWFV